MKRSLVVALVAACGTTPDPVPAPAPVDREPPPSTEGAPPTDKPAPSQDEKLAAIQKAMNELDEGVQACWAASAARERFDLDGEYKALIDISATAASATLTTDTVRNAGLASCLVTLLNAYKWAPPLYGDSIQLPFRVRAPSDGQNVIDRRLVPFNGQGKTAVAVLLDDANSGNDAASIFEIAIGGGGSTGMRVAEREELWYFLGPASVNDAGGGKVRVDAATMVHVPKGGVREVLSSTGDVHAVVVVFPGGREGAARAGALPTPVWNGATRAMPVKPIIVAPDKAKTHGPATIYFDSATGPTSFAAEILTLQAGAQVAEHVHAKETELLYILEGEGTMTVAGVPLAVTATSVVQVPPNTKHAFAATTTVRAVQLYTPGGPEQRFKAPKK